MPLELLQHERVAAAIYQILSGKRMTEQMNACLLDAAPLIVSRYGLPQAVLRKLSPCFGAEQIIIVRAPPEAQILPQNRNHLTAKGNDLRLAVFCMPIIDKTVFQVHVSDLNCPDCRGSAAAVQQKVDNDPIPILRKAAFARVGFFSSAASSLSVYVSLTVSSPL